MDLEVLRAITPGCRHRNYLNNAGASLMTQPVLDTVVDHLRREAEIGAYSAQAEAMERIEAVYASAARLIGARPAEIALMENATRSWQAAFYSLHLGPGDRVITGRAEYGSNVLAYLQVCARTGAEVVVAPDDASGQVDVDALAGLIDDRTKLIGITHVPTNGGVVNPAAEIGAVARAAGIPYLLDACQSVGQFPVDVESIGCDFLSATGRKFLRAPRGVGFLYVRESALGLLDPWVAEMQSASRGDGDALVWMPGSQRFETFERNNAAQLGLGVAIEAALGIGIESIGGRTEYLGRYLRDGLSGLPGVACHDLGVRRCAIVTATVAGRDSAGVVDALAARNITVTATDEHSNQFDERTRGLGSMVRFSPHYFNTEEELDAAVAAVRELI